MIPAKAIIAVNLNFSRVIICPTNAIDVYHQLEELFSQLIKNHEFPLMLLHVIDDHYKTF